MNRDMKLEFVRAGAGSGKTHYLTQLLASRLREGQARPQALMVTTFTVSAATQLRQRARNALLQEGRLDLAAAIGQARIGTVNSVCGQLIQRFCFELAIAPDQTVVDEDGAKRLMRIAIESVQSGPESAALMQLASRMSLPEDGVVERVRDIVNLARSNNISAEAVARMGGENADAMLTCWPAADGDHTAALVEALTAAQGQLQGAVDGGNTTGVLRKGLEQVTKALDDLALDRFSWADWQKLVGLAAGAAQTRFVAPVHGIARRHGTHSQFHADVRSYTQTTFDLAARAMDAFAQAKREHGVVDFTDQEVMLLRAIQESEFVRSALSDELDLVLVDEFQDTNPLQLAIFVELARLARASVWVGDPKQAIYGFRGTDSSLIQQVLSAVESWGGTLGEPLSQSWRSTPALVELTNQVFADAFPPTPRQDVVLTATRPALQGQPDLLNWSFVRGANRHSFDFTAVGPAVHGLLVRNLNVFDKETQELRAMRAGDIAVLCRKNSHIPEIVESLNAWGIPAGAERPGLLKTPEVRLVLACLRRLHDAADTVASATIVSLVDSLEPEEWLDDRLAFMAQVEVDDENRNVPPLRDWRVRGEAAHPLLVRLEELRPRLMSLTPCEALQLAKAESGVARLAHQWSNTEHGAQSRIANVEALLALANDYQDACLGMHQPATVAGLLLWLNRRASNARDGRAAATHGAVQVMTFHGAKGLEWPVVLVAGLDHRHWNDLWNVRARTDGEFDAKNPLANRFIHYWPYPFGWVRDVPQAQAAEQSALGQAMDAEAKAENARLLYVSLTRARDLLVLVGDSWEAGRAPGFSWIDGIGARASLWGRSETRDINGVMVARENMEWTPDDARAAPPAQPAQALRFFEMGAPRAHEALWFTPSAAHEETHHVAEIEDVGTRIAVRQGCDFLNLGSAVHGCLAYAHADPAQPLALAEVQEILERWGVAGMVEPDAVIAQIEAFTLWWQTKWPGAQASSEVPIEARRPDGSIVRGQIDFMLCAAQGRVIVDHKAHPGAVGDDDDLARKHGGQLDAYEQALHIATGEDVLGTWLFLPVAAKAVRLARN